MYTSTWSVRLTQLASHSPELCSASLGAAAILQAVLPLLAPRHRSSVALHALHSRYAAAGCSSLRIACRAECIGSSAMRTPPADGKSPAAREDAGATMPAAHSGHRDW